MIEINGSIFEHSSDNTFAYQLFKSLIGEYGLNLTSSIKKFNERYPEDKTTAQNLSNKLSRDSIRLTEFFKFMDAIGYHVSFQKDGLPVRNDQPKTPEPNIRVANNSMFAIALNDGYASCISPNFGEIIIAGERAEDAAKWLHGHITEDMTEAQEVSAILNANNLYSVVSKPTNSFIR